MANADPFFAVRADVTDQYNALNQKLSQFHVLQASDPRRKQLASKMEADCEFIKSQLDALRAAVNVASEDPARFSLTMQEIGSRREWLDTMGRQVKGIRDQVRIMMAPPAVHVPTAADRVVASNDAFVASEGQKQATIIRAQDQSLGDIEVAVTRVGELGLAIKDHLVEDEKLLGEFTTEVDTTHSRLRATQKKMVEIIKKSGTTKQLVLIVFLIVVLIILAVFVFY